MATEQQDTSRETAVTDVVLCVVTLVCFALACSFLTVFGLELKCVEESLLPRASTRVLIGLPEGNAAPVQMWIHKALDSQLVAFSVRRQLSLTHMLGGQHPPCCIAWF